MDGNDFKIAVFGLGHIGLPTAAIFADKGLEVVGVARNERKMEMINNGIPPIMETGLKTLLNSAIEKNKFIATSDGVEASKISNVHIIIVPTPKDNANNSELSAVTSVAETISKGLKSGDLVIVESTVPPKTCETIVVPLLEKSGFNAGEDFGVAYTPERAIPTSTIHEMTHNPRVIGGIDDKSTDTAADLYSMVTEGKIIKVKNTMTAEIVKLMENIYRDVNIALANEFSMICRALGADVIEAIDAANHHPRVNIHTPGPGVGGHCISIDPYFLIESANNNGVKVSLIQTSRDVNNSMPLQVVKLVKSALKESGKSVSHSKIGILGVAYKGNIADTRETPAKPLIETLNDEGGEIYIHDPYVPPETIQTFAGKPAALQDVLKCDCVVLVTDHDLYRNITPEMVEKKVFVSTRPIINPEDFRKKGFIFRGIGRC
ncbi:nucleotide sugar dehydrogenase [Methanobacterium paludis]|uniref:UDP-N-acetyl-D-mannosamine dehydrogenase n=1 Tax=Methanobacterium paludis (strain DSM 25820 / JCM 18151 / SWAN1) TaxID=868131 RepID=F6D6Z6_METPW|nr:nucleotide sugar dehydrogenase [Methanobacterium paludis]AEG18363.1 nucleotide sugar dehydrogenase [Methanobacterium paludis]